MKFLALPLVLLIFLGLISTLYVSATVSGATERIFTNSSNVGGFTSTLNSTETITAADVAVSMTTSNGLLAFVVAMVALAAILGITALGSGLNQMSIKIVVMGTAALTLWGVFSALALTGLTGGVVNGVSISGIPYGFGWLIYLVMTISFSFGVLEEISGGSGV